MACSVEKAAARSVSEQYKTYQTQYRSEHRVAKPTRPKLSPEERKRRNREIQAKHAKTEKRREYRRVWASERYSKDEQYVIIERLRSRLRKAISSYSLGEIVKDSSHGIPWQEIVEQLGVCPGPRHEWDIGHKQPCCSFDHSDPEQVLKCWAVDNLEWQPRSENRQRAGLDRSQSIRRQK